MRVSEPNWHEVSLQGDHAAHDVTAQGTYWAVVKPASSTRRAAARALLKFIGLKEGRKRNIRPLSSVCCVQRGLDASGLALCRLLRQMYTSCLDVLVQCREGLCLVLLSLGDRRRCHTFQFSFLLFRTMPIGVQTKLFINNEFVDALSGKTFKTVNPFDESVGAC